MFSNRFNPSKLHNFIREKLNLQDVHDPYGGDREESFWMLMVCLLYVSVWQGK